MTLNQRADLYLPIESNRVGPAPVVIRTIITPVHEMVAGGMPSTSRKYEDYVLLSALPKEIQERIRVAVQAIVNGM